MYPSRIDGSIDCNEDICGICHDTLHLPVKLVTGHIYCEPCIDSWFEISDKNPMTNLKITKMYTRLHSIIIPFAENEENNYDNDYEKEDNYDNNNDDNYDNYGDSVMIDDEYDTSSINTFFEDDE
jgi:hypothetical protein